ncbi:MAG: PhoH family protein, partial [Gammaproteobacteria bacterium]|nr:PhoH family protein [Gammaproteobacteria bacterium]
MPLPPAPSRRAALLAPEAFDVAARPRTAQTATTPDVVAVAAPAKAPTGRARASAPAVSNASAPLVQIETRGRVPEPVTAPSGRARLETVPSAPAPAAR